MDAWDTIGEAKLAVSVFQKVIYFVSFNSAQFFRSKLYQRQAMNKV